MNLPSPFNDFRPEYNEQGEITEILLLYAVPVQEEVFYKGALREGHVLGVRVESVEQIEQLIENATKREQISLLLCARAEFLQMGIQPDCNSAMLPSSPGVPLPSPDR
jgi:hypothetical protein